MWILNKHIEGYVKKNRANPTEAEKRAAELLRDLEVDFVFQHPIAIKGEKWVIADFYLPDDQLVIEVNGGYHKKHKQKGLDWNRANFIRNAGYRLVWFRNEVVLKQPNVFKAAVGNKLKYRKRKISLDPIVTPPLPVDAEYLAVIQ